jgi:hypothetical protein
MDQWVDAAPLVQPPPDTDIDVNSITFPDATVLTSAYINRLDNGNFTALFGDFGQLLVRNSNTEQNYFNLIPIGNEDDTYGVQIGIGNQAGWTFLDNGTLTLPASSNDFYTTTNALIKSIADIQISAGDDVGSNWVFGGNGDLTLPSGGHIGPSGGKGLGTTYGAANDHLVSLTSYYNSGLYSSCVTAYADGTLNITAYNDGGPNPAKIWTFANDGILTIPGDIRSENAINIDINLSDSTLRRWTFSEGGDLTFPDNTVQTTAYTGGVVIPAASNLEFALGTDFTGTIIGDFGDGTGYIRVESNTGEPFFTPSPIGTEFYNFLATLTAGTEFTVNTVVDGTTYNTVVSFTQFSGGNPVAPNRNDLYYTFVSGDTLPFSYNATALTLTFEGSTFSFTTSAVTFPDNTVQTTAYLSGQQTILVDAVSALGTEIDLNSLTGTVMLILPADGYTTTGDTHTVNLPILDSISLGTRITVINRYNGVVTVNGWLGPGWQMAPYSSIDLVYHFAPEGPSNMWWVTGNFIWD